MDVIGELLRASLLGELGSDEERAEKLRAASSGVADHLEGQSRTDLSSVLLAVTDSAGRADSTALALAQRELLDRWETFPNVFPETPLEILRAVALAGVTEVAARDETIQAAAWYGLRTALEVLPDSRWSAVLHRILNAWSTSVDHEIAALWTPASASASLRMPSLGSNNGAISVKTDLPARAQQMADAGSYPDFATTLQGSFATYTSDLIQVAQSAASTASSRANVQLKDALAALGTKLRETIAAHDQTVTAVTRRSNLLWWRETAYSTRLRKRYAELPTAADITIAAALDLHQEVPALTPIAVEHLLADVVAAHTEQSDALAIDDLSTADSAKDLPQPNTEASPATLLQAIYGPGRPSPLLRDGTDATPAKVAVLLFRDLQAARILTTD